MGLQSAMTTALTGLQAAETQIDVIGNNVANSNTVGFKASEVVFATQFLQTQSIGSAPSDSSGGTNPRQIGLGVKVSAITPDFTQGTIEISSNALDLAIQGDGFLMVQSSQGEPLYTRNGQLSINSENQVVNSTGNLLLGYGVDDSFNLETAVPQPITIPLGSERVAQATTEAVFEGVLNPTVQEGDTPGQTTSEVLIDASTPTPSTDTDFTTDDLSITLAPTAGATAATANGTSLDAGDYTYRVTYVDANGNESSASAEFYAVGVAAGDEIELSGLPVDSSGNWDDVRIYRTDQTGTGDFYEVATVTMGTTNYTDSTPDSGLGAVGSDLDSALDNGTYTYYLTYYNSSNSDESIPSEALGTYAIGDNTSSIHIDLFDLDVPDSDSGFNQIKIYRNASGDANTFYEVDTVNAPWSGGVDTYVDTTPSTDITSNSSLDIYGSGSARVGAGTRLLDVQAQEGGAFVSLFEEGTLSFTGKVGGAAAATQELDITSTTTVQELMDFMNQALGLQEQSNVAGVDLPAGGGFIDVIDGQIIVTSNYGEANEIDIPLTAFRLTPTGSEVSQSVPIGFSLTQEADGPGTTTEYVVYDSLGTPVTVRVTTVLEDTDGNSTTYRWYASSGDSQPGSDDLSIEVGNGLLVFDSNGNLVSSPADSISIDRNLTAGESPLEVGLNFDAVTSLAVTNASGGAVSSLNMVSQDGFPPGVLTDFVITDDGLIQGQFSNGTQQVLGQVLMAGFANPQGLEQVGNGLYRKSVNSGEATVSVPGENGLGTVTSGALELSNTDVGEDLVEMILAQTQYQAGSRVISTAQEMLDELLALGR